VRLLRALFVLSEDLEYWKISSGWSWRTAKSRKWSRDKDRDRRCWAYISILAPVNPNPATHGVIDMEIQGHTLVTRIVTKAIVQMNEDPN
jgi:hypothetical protein